MSDVPRGLVVVRPWANPVARLASALVDLVTGPFRGSSPASSAAWGASSASRSGAPVGTLNALHVGLEYELSGTLRTVGGVMILDPRAPFRVGAQVVESIQINRDLPQTGTARLHGALVRTPDGFALSNVSDMNAGEPLYDSGRFLDVRGNVLETKAVAGGVRVFDIRDKRVFDAQFEGGRLTGFVDVAA